jgi:LuxR family maltose regulon positive regulatory protein
MPEQLFHSNVPIVRGNQIYLERPRIDRLLEQAVKKPLVIVNAGAGYGKSQAVYSFVRKYNTPTGWLQLSERDNVGERFWENFIAGITPGNKKAAIKLEKIEFPETERQFDRYLTIPKEETRTDVKYIFAYDDFHLIHDKAVLRFMERSITSPFPNITSILISRTEPPLNLAALESQGLLTRITEEDLRFTREEMAAYFRLLEVNPSPQIVSSIYHDTEGWAFAIHLAGLSLKHAPSGAVYVNQALRSNIFKLISSEIMAPLPLPTRRFLIKLSLIEHLVPELLEELAEDPAILEKMKDLDSFIRFDVYLGAYHIHHLFLDYLKDIQDELTEYDKQDLWHKTAVWCAANNRKMDAISYYEKAGDYERLIDVAYTLPLVMPNRIVRILLEILNRAPEEIYDQIAIAHVLRTRLYITLEMFDKAWEELTAVIAKLEARPPSPAVYRTLTGCYNNLGFAGMITSSYTRDYDYAWYFARAEYFYAKNPFELKPPVSMAPLGSYLCRVTSEEEGEVERYIKGIAAMAAHTSRTMTGCSLGLDDLAWGELAFFRGDMASSERMVREALQKARQSNQYETENRALFYLLRINLARGTHEAIGDMMKQLEAQLSEPHYHNRFIYHDIVTGWYYAQTGQPDKLASWLRNNFEESDLNSLAFGLEILVKAKYHFSEKHYPAVLAVLESRAAGDSRWDFVFGKIETQALKAVSCYRNRDKEDAFAALETAYRAALPNKLFMPFTELGKDMRALVEAALKDKATGLPREWLEKMRLGASAYAKKLFTVAEHSRPVTSRTGEENAEENLSRREMEVLTDLFQGMTREEIAVTSSLSANTVRSVIRSIYNKLGAINKADALRIAVARGIVGSGG